MAAVIGIDLGTTNTVVAVVRDGQVTAIPDEAGRTLIPSVVSFHPSGNVLVGHDARTRRLVDSPNTIYSVKRLIGRSWESEEVQRARMRFAFSMREGPGQATLVVGRGETYTLPEISAFVLRRAKQVAEAALGETVDRAVITVPANFNDLQRAATKVAGRVAGLEVLRILNEPTAAALAYGFGKSVAERIAVYDFGGGTFDVTLLDLSDNVFEVLATAGNTFLGGDDIDLLIAERMAEAFLATHRYDPRTDPQAFERLRAAAEEVKRRLSAEPEASTELADLGHGTGGKSLSLTFRMKRVELEALITPILERTFDTCREALAIARRSARDFDQILLVGGSTRVPLVRRRVEEFFGREVKANVNPDEVVALGAAIQGNALTAAERRRATMPPAPAAARRSQPGGKRPRAETIPGVAPPSTQSFAERARGTAPLVADDAARADGSALPHGDPALGVLGRPGEKPRLGTTTLDGLGARGKIRTGTGLSPPKSEREPLPPFAAASLAEPDADETTRSMKRATREESVAFTLGDADLEYVSDASRPNWSLPQPTPLEPGSTPYGQEDIITQSGARPEGVEDEPTKITRVSLSDVEAALAEITPQTRPLLATGFGSTAPLVQPLWALGVDVPPPQPLPPEPPPPPPPLSPPVAPFGFGQIADPTLPQPRAAVTSPLSPLVSTLPLPRAPLLVDVTPLTLAVETVQGFCDPIIDRNTPVPCAQTREFVTASDRQTVVRVRVAQGESKRFEENTLLGEVELSGLPPAPRGTVQISVTFALDASGMLNVSAAEVATGRATRANLRLVGLPGPSEIAEMMDRQKQQLG